MPKVNPSWANEIRHPLEVHPPHLSPRKDSRASSTVYLGIDPGVSGGLAILSSDGTVQVTHMSHTDKDLWEWFARWAPKHPQVSLFAVIEKVASSPQMGVVSAFTFGMGRGKLLMALTAAAIPFEEVTPQSWQKGLGIPKRGKTESKGQFKNRLKQKASQLFPDVSITLATCDALLLAEYVRRKREGRL
jgi:Holliday junction resolvasome RuvABC endonuclease subunit